MMERKMQKMSMSLLAPAPCIPEEMQVEVEDLVNTEIHYIQVGDQAGTAIDQSGIDHHQHLMRIMMIIL